MSGLEYGVWDGDVWNAAKVGWKFSQDSTASKSGSSKRRFTHE